MAKPIKGQLPMFGAALRGRFVLQPGRAGAHIQSWPVKKPKKKTPAQERAVRLFQEAATAAKNINATEMNMARDLSDGTQMMPRDLIYQALYGRLATFLMVDGRKFYSVAAHNDVSNVLDAINNQTGGILVRGPTWWAQIQPGEAGFVLTSTGPDSLPEYQAPSGAGGPAWFDGAAVHGSLATWNVNGRTRGYIIEPRNVMELARIKSFIEASTTSDTYRAVVAQVNQPGASAQVTAIVARTSTVQATLTSKVLYYWDWPAETVLLPGSFYFIGTEWVAGGTGSLSGQQHASLGDIFSPNLPANFYDRAISYDTSTLAVGMTPLTSNTLQWPVLWTSGYALPDL